MEYGYTVGIVDGEWETEPSFDGTLLDAFFISELGGDNMDRGRGITANADIGAGHPAVPQEIHM